MIQVTVMTPVGMHSLIVLAGNPVGDEPIQAQSYRNGSGTGDSCAIGV